MGIGSKVLTLIKDISTVTDSVDRLWSAHEKLADKTDGMNERLIKLEARLDTYVEIAKANRLEKNS